MKSPPISSMTLVPLSAPLAKDQLICVRIQALASEQGRSTTRKKTLVLDLGCRDFKEF